VLLVRKLGVVHLDRTQPSPPLGTGRTGRSVAIHSDTAGIAGRRRLGGAASPGPRVDQQRGAQSDLTSLRHHRLAADAADAADAALLHPPLRTGHHQVGLRRADGQEKLDVRTEQGVCEAAVRAELLRRARELPPAHASWAAAAAVTP
jgi:hypothetical protein